MTRSARTPTPTTASGWCARSIPISRVNTTASTTSACSTNCVPARRSDSTGIAARCITRSSRTTAASTAQYTGGTADWSPTIVDQPAHRRTPDLLPDQPESSLRGSGQLHHELRAAPRIAATSTRGFETSRVIAAAARHHRLTARGRWTRPSNVACDSTDNPNTLRFCDESGNARLGEPAVDLPFRHEFKLGANVPLVLGLRNQRRAAKLRRRAEGRDVDGHPGHHAIPQRLRGRRLHAWWHRHSQPLRRRPGGDRFSRSRRASVTCRAARRSTSGCEAGVPAGRQPPPHRGVQRLQPVERQRGVDRVAGARQQRVGRAVRRRRSRRTSDWHHVSANHAAWRVGQILGQVGR